MRRLVPLFVFMLLQAAVAMPAAAEPVAPVVRMCEGGKGISHQLSIANCTAMIRAPGAPTKFRGLAYVMRGRHHYFNKDYDRAITDFDTGLKLHPNYAPAIHNRGLAYAAKGDHDHAIEDYDRAIALSPNDMEIRADRAAAYGAKGDNERATADYAMVVTTRLKRVMHYPREAVTRSEEGVVGVAFTLDRTGKLIESRVTESSGNFLFDREALAMIERAQPFPASPLRGRDTVDFATAIRFQLR
jgi:TonB family protein